MFSMKVLKSPLIDYPKMKTIEKIGGFPIHLSALQNLDDSLEKICSIYQPETPEEEELLLNLCPYFGVVWPSARALAKFMSERKTQFNKKRGIEVGCGLALPAILGAKIGALMQASDFHPDVGAWVDENASLNQVRIEYMKWDWTRFDSLPGNLAPGEYDFVLASDVLYEKRHPEDLVRALIRLIKPEGTIYLSDPGRAYLERALQEFETLGFRPHEFEYEVEESSSRPEIRLEKTRRIQVFELIRS